MGNFNSTTIPIQTAEVDSWRSTDHSQDLTGNIIHRLPINQSAIIGSLYDAIEDRLLEAPVLDIPSMSVTSLGTTHHAEIEIGILQGKTLLDIIRIDKELCLSIYLDIVTSQGISLLINLPYVINQYTRYLSYYYPTKQTYFTDALNDIQSKVIPNDIYATTATHIVTSIQCGVHIVVILQLSPEYEAKLDRLLTKIKNQWKTNIFRIDPNEERLFNQFTDINVFSNIPDIAKLTKLTNVCQKLIEIIPDVTKHRALAYTLWPIRWFFPSYPADGGIYYSLKEEDMDQLELYLYQLLLARKSLKVPLDPEVKKLLENYLEPQFDEVQQQMLKVEELYQEKIKRSASLIWKIRHGDVEQDAYNESLVACRDRVLLENVCDVSHRLNGLKEKAQLINELGKYDIEYWNVKELVKNNDHDLQTIAKHLINSDNRKPIFCFDDKFEKRYSPPWNQFYGRLIYARENNAQLELVYGDFSFCSYQLLKMKMLSSEDIIEQPKVVQEKQASNATPPISERIRFEQSTLPTVKFINVLLLGESGVGKSTFINALVNYLTFDTLEQARSGERIVLMPVSFLMTVGDAFEERIVRFGGQDPNEDHNQSGQSVTQHCRSYVFTIGIETKIRLIDTPGMGDTRGLDQDDRNMQHILSYINNLSHLDAICILLKPNEARLNVILRSYFTRFLGFLGENARNNVLFCFTNTRTTFFTPGDTAPPLKRMLDNTAIKHIPFVKSNTFCFDSESFRYLIALKNGVKFDDCQKEEYTQSWRTSVNESNRFLQYICSELQSYPKESWQSIEHAQFQIIQLIRPMLETIRNTLRNTLLLDRNLSKPLIKLHSTPVPRNSSVCLDCKRPELFGEFWIVRDKVHALSHRCDKCHCDVSRHKKIDYVLTYETSFEQPRLSLNDMSQNLDRLKQMLTEFLYFFKDVLRFSKETDPILSAFNQMINEEKYLCSQKVPNVLNSYLCDELKDLQKYYENRWITSVSNREPMTLPEIYKLIKTVSGIDTINEQLNAIKQTQEIYMTEQERLVS